MRSFLNACGFREPLRLVVEGPRPADGGTRPLPQPFAVIGRDPRADVVLDDLRVSRRHVYLQAIAGQLFWVDLESRTGTCDETGTRKWGWLAAGGLLQIGPFVVRRAAGEARPGELGPPRDDPDRESPLAVRGYGREPLPEVTLEFLNGPSQATTWPMNRMMSLIGSAKGCKFRLTDPSVSAFHASLLRTPTALWVVDLRGDRGLSVNDEPVRFGPLVDGDVLGIGRYRMRIRCREAPGAADGPDRASSAGLPVLRPRGEVARRPAGGPVAIPPAFGGSVLPMPPPPFPVVASASGVEVVSSDAAILAARGHHPEAGDSALLPLVNQFGMMQQQMFDQFQQAMGMLVQMFSTMHREQMDVIREELDRLHELTRELQELKDELARSPGRAAAPAAGPATSPVPILPPATPNPARAPAAGAPAGSPAGPRPSPGAAAAPGLPPAGPRPDQARPGAGLRPAGDAEAADLPRDTVSWIHHRIAAIQQERETRWQKIVKLLPGMS
jgi:hypothetical protein